MKMGYIRKVIKDAAIAQLVERIHGKDEVSGSNPDRGSIFYPEIKHLDNGCFFVA